MHRNPSKKIPKTAVGNKSLENQYREVFRNILVPKEDAQSLEQPSIYKEIPTVTTYGAYQEPL